MAWSAWAGLINPSLSKYPILHVGTDIQGAEIFEDGLESQVGAVDNKC